jgi:hypothetical protein
MIVAGDGLGDEYYIAVEIRYDLAVEAGRLVFSRPQVRYSAPGPARCQEAIYQDCLAAGSGPGLVGAGRDSAVAFSIRGVISVMAREIVGCEVSKTSAQTSSVIFCRAYPDDTIMASRRLIGEVVAC